MSKSERRMLTRRSLLTLAASVVGLGGAGVIAVGVRMPDYSPSVRLQALDAIGGAVLARSAEHFLPRGHGFPALDTPQLLRVLDEAIGLLDDVVRSQVLLGLKAFEVAAIAHGTPWRAFSELADAPANDYVQSWLKGSRPQRALVAALRQLVHVAYWQTPTTWAAAHYPGPLHLRADVPALGPAPRPLT